MGERNLFNKLGQTASPYAYSLAGANAAAIMDDKWFGGARPDYLNVSMAAISNTVGSQFGVKAETWFARGTTKTVSINDKNAFYFPATEYSSEQPMYGDASRGAITPYKEVLPLITMEVDSETGMSRIVDPVESALEGVKSFFNSRIKAVEEWSRDSVPFQYSWATPQINTGNPRLDQYYFQPVNDLVSTVANVGWNGLRLAGNATTIVTNSPVALFSAWSGDYDASQQFYDDLIVSNAPTNVSLGNVRAGLGYLSGARNINKAITVGRTMGASQRGSASLSLLDDIPIANTDGTVLTASMPASPIKALYPSTASTQIKAPFVSSASRTLHFDNIDTFNRAANNPTPNTSYKYSDVTWTTDNLSCVSTVEGVCSYKSC